MSKGLYHSELARMGRIEARVLSDVKASNYQGKPPFVALDINGVERLYNCENEDCEKALEGLKGRSVILEARGSRESAQIAIETLDGAKESNFTESGNPLPKMSNKEIDRTYERIPEPETYAEQQAREAKAFVDGTRYSAKAGLLFQICYVHARLIYKAEDFPNMSDYELEDLRMRCAQFLAIEAKGKIDVSKLPPKWPSTTEDLPPPSGWTKSVRETGDE